VDTRGLPAVGVPVSYDWAMVDGRLTRDHVCVTDEEGRFSGLTFTGRAVALMAVDHDRHLGGYRVVTSVEEEIVIRLEPLATVRGELICSFFDERPTGNYVSIQVPVPGHWSVTIAHQETGDASSFRILLPPGSYDYHFYTPGIEFRREDGTFTVAAGEDLDLGALDFGVTPIAHFYGKQPPALRATDVAGAGPDISWEDYRGKWVLAYFFAYT
jgi:hypothetical protein